MTTEKEPGTLGKILALLTPRERKTGLLVLGMMLVLAFLETAGVASVMPFLAVLGNQEMVETNPGLAWAYEAGGFESTDAFLLVLGAGAFLLVLISAGFRILTTYAINRWVQMREYSIGARLLQTYLRQPYEFFLDRNSADLSKSILSEVKELTDTVLRPGMYLLAYGAVAVVLIGFLIWVDPVIAIIVAVAVCGAYGLIYLGVRGVLRRMGGDRLKANEGRFTAASEAFGGIKDLKVLGREEAYLKRFRAPAARYARYQSLSKTLSTVPKYLIEAIGFGGVLLLALVLMAGDGDLGAVLPILGLYTLAGYRLLPAAQHMYAGVSQLRFAGPAVAAVYGDLSTMAPAVERRPSSGRRPAKGPGSEGGEGLRFANVTFYYPRASAPAISNIDLTIRWGGSVGFVGRTGAGKTTLIDLILGLLTPSDGTLLVDGTALSGDTVTRWQQHVGYVPQTVYLADASISENIAFGLEPDEIDHDRVVKVAKAAQIDEFITESLSRGYQSEVGERGVRLSGGQRQRIGIARALYHNPSILVLDEATSALDTETERAIMRSVEKLRGEKTIIMIAHRLSTVEQCDEIVVLDSGCLVGRGTYNELMDSNLFFQRLAVA